MSDQLFQDILSNGELYYPALKRYAYDKTVEYVVCDRCCKTHIPACVGYKEYDLCLLCASVVANGSIPFGSTSTGTSTTAVATAATTLNESIIPPSMYRRVIDTSTSSTKTNQMVTMRQAMFSTFILPSTSTINFPFTPSHPDFSTYKNTTTTSTTASTTENTHTTTIPSLPFSNTNNGTITSSSSSTNGNGTEKIQDDLLSSLESKVFVSRMVQDMYRNIEAEDREKGEN